MTRFSRKALNVALVATTIFSFGATPAFASDELIPSSAADPLTAIAPQALSTVITPKSNPALERMLDLATIGSGPTASFDVDAAIALAEQEIGTSRVTGWSMPGECIMSAQRWIQHGGGEWTGSGTPVDNYAGATRLPFELAQPGDIIQYENIYAPHAWVTGVHTVMVTAVHEDGTVDIIQSNIPFGSGLVTKETNWVPIPPEGFQAVVWRF